MGMEWNECMGSVWLDLKCGIVGYVLVHAIQYMYLQHPTQERNGVDDNAQLVGDLVGVFEWSVEFETVVSCWPTQWSFPTSSTHPLGKDSQMWLVPNKLIAKGRRCRIFYQAFPVQSEFEPNEPKKRKYGHTYWRYEKEMGWKKGKIIPLYTTFDKWVITLTSKNLSLVLLQKKSQ